MKYDQRFELAYQAVIKEQSDILPIQFDNNRIKLDDLVTVVKTMHHADGRTFISRRIAGCYENYKYILHQGKYGSLIVVKPDNVDPFIVKSPEYTLLGDGEFTAKQHELESLVLEGVSYGFKLEGITHWYDSCYRKDTGREVSKNFNALSVLERIINQLKPGFDILNKYHNAIKPDLTFTNGAVA
jgi:hypothetical protein